MRENKYLFRHIIGNLFGRINNKKVINFEDSNFNTVENCNFGTQENHRQININNGIYIEKYIYGSSINQDTSNDEQIFFVPQIRNMKCCGRDNELWDLKDRLLKNKIQVITGLPGVGKSRLALKYAIDNKQHYKLVAWIKCSSKEEILKSFLELAKYLKLGYENKTVDTIIQEVIFKVLDTERVLLIFDDAIDYKMIYDYLPIEYDNMLSIIITSKNSNWNELTPPMKINPFDEETAIDFLLERTQLEDREWAKIVGNLLGNLPIALVQAASYIEYNKIGFRDYVELYNKYKMDVLESGEPSKDYEYTIKSVGQIGLDAISKENNLSKNLMYIFAFLSPDSLPRRIVENKITILEEVLDTNVDILNLNNALANLNKYSLIELSKSNISIHCLIIESIKAILRDTNENNETMLLALKLFCNIFPNNFLDEVKIIDSFSLISHFEALVDNITIYGDCLQEKRLIAELLYKGAIAFKLLLQTEKAMSYAQKAYDIFNHYGDSENNHLNMASVLLAGIMIELGEDDKAQDIYLGTLDRLRADNDERNVSIILNNIANLFKKRGDYFQAIIYLKKSLKELEKFDDMEKSKITILCNICDLETKSGQYEEARSHIDEAISLAEKIYTKKSLHYSKAINNKAVLLSSLGEHNEEYNLYMEAISIDESFYPKSHKELLVKKINLGICLLNLNEIDQLENLIDKIEPLVIKHYGTENKLYADTLELKAYIALKRKREDKYIININEAYHLRKKLYEPMHPIIIDSEFNLAIAHEKVGNKGDAIQNYKEAIKKYKDIYGNNSKLTIEKTRIVIDALIDLEEYSDAINFCKELLSSSSSTFGEKSIEVSWCYMKMGYIYYKSSNYNKALDKLNKAHTINKSNKGRNNAIITENLFLIYKTLGDNGNIIKAMEYLGKAFHESLELDNEHIELKMFVENEYYNFTTEYSNYTGEVVSRLDRKRMSQVLKDINLITYNIGDTLIIDARKNKS
ncbi:tetratricopeptide repeat protein [Clostridium cylindrosporum]|uniref:TPR repeat-containing protein n=1 Tax=Clostridium cylindrosporum DSM 605 TaxID=1121307 RepID=A0A0J8FYU9_CLOCY|nr:tetratricopeptide repeat protein [Clostridium cylindrosporum]KMT20791.1 TPR repeat-containing protein [Clostridium cylindrosporum DSM 605]